MSHFCKNTIAHVFTLKLSSLILKLNQIFPHFIIALLLIKQIRMSKNLHNQITLKVQPIRKCKVCPISTCRDLKTYAGLVVLFPFKGGNPAAGSPTATLLRLHPSHQHQLGHLPPEG